jgi:hypothetical protein
MTTELRNPLFVEAGSVTASVMRIAEARMAVQYLERAEDWAAGLDEDILTEMTLVHRLLLAKIESLSISRGGER